MSTIFVANLFWVNLADKGDGLEILQTEVWELEKFSRHERHDNVETVEADICCRHCVSILSSIVRGRKVNEVLRQNCFVNI